MCALATAEGLAARVRRRCAPCGAAVVCVAFSGGLDSTVLLDLLARLRDAAGLARARCTSTTACARNADAWAEACAAIRAPRAACRSRSSA